MLNKLSPTETASPTLTLTEATVPALNARISVSIFMASRITTVTLLNELPRLHQYLEYVAGQRCCLRLATRRNGCCSRTGTGGAGRRIRTERLDAFDVAPR